MYYHAQRGLYYIHLLIHCVLDNYSYMYYAFSATDSELDRIESILGPLPNFRVMALQYSSPEDHIIVTCNIESWAQSVIALIANDH